MHVDKGVPMHADDRQKGDALETVINPAGQGADRDLGLGTPKLGDYVHSQRAAYLS